MTDTVSTRTLLVLLVVAVVFSVLGTFAGVWLAEQDGAAVVVSEQQVTANVVQSAPSLSNNRLLVEVVNPNQGDQSNE